jgi:large subunit ribosomal protein L22
MSNLNISNYKGVATHKNMRASAQKVRLVINMIRSKQALEAQHILSASTKKCAKYVLHLLKSAIANSKLDTPQDLYISNAYANEGQYIKRIRPGSRGNILRFCRRTAHVTITVETNEESLKWDRK